MYQTGLAMPKHRRRRRAASRRSWSGPNWNTTVLLESDHGEAARDRQHAQRHHEGWKSEIGDQNAIEGAHQQRRHTEAAMPV